MTRPRVRYRERQRLTAGDLLAEQEYQAGAAGRHHLGHHDWGVVRGLGIYQEGADWLVQAGIAIDGYGRELILPQPVPISLDAGGSNRVILYYCEEPWPTPGPGTCVPDPSPRIRQTGRVAVRAEDDPWWSDPRDWPPTPIDEATAAGGVGELRPWPVVLGTITANHEMQLGAVRYVRARARGVRAPSGRAMMKLGRRALSDRYHFAVATRDAMGVEADRFTIDRDGVLRFVKTLAVLGGQASAMIPLTETAFLHVSALHLGIPGDRVRVSVKIIADKERRILEAVASRRERSGTVTHLARYDLTKALLPKRFVAAEREERTGSQVRPIVGLEAAGLETTGSPLVRFQLVDVHGRPFGLRQVREDAVLPPADSTPVVGSRLVDAHGQPFSPAILREMARPGPERANEATIARELIRMSTPAPTEHVARLQPSGGVLSIHLKTDAPIDKPSDPLCIDKRRDEATESKSPGGSIRLRPGVGPPTNPLTRFFYSRRHSSPAVISDELQLGLGLYLESDYAPRMAVGSRESGADFGPWFSIACNGKVSVTRVSASDDLAKNPELVRVNGTVILPPVKAVPADPLFDALLLVGYIYGLRSISGVSQAVSIGFQSPMPQLSPGSTHSLPVQLTRLVSQTVTLKSAVVRLFFSDGTSTVTSVPPPTPATLPLTLQVPVSIPASSSSGMQYRVDLLLRLSLGALEAAASGSSDSGAIT